MLLDVAVDVDVDVDDLLSVLEEDDCSRSSRVGDDRLDNNILEACEDSVGRIEDRSFLRDRCEFGANPSVCPMASKVHRTVAYFIIVDRIPKESVYMHSITVLVWKTRGINQD